jgi:hypothetical protein
MPQVSPDGVAISRASARNSNVEVWVRHSLVMLGSLHSGYSHLRPASSPPCFSMHRVHVVRVPPMSRWPRRVSPDASGVRSLIGAGQTAPQCVGAGTQAWPSGPVRR